MSEAVKTEQERELGFFARIVRFIQEVITELRKVVYPTKNELWTYFLVVIVFVAVLMAFIGGIDFLFGWLSKLVFA
ncbi:preprotein translocase subunit SecE [Boudabousia marimammalium]|uniref:Protein translocase subunit SecE n=1 Tax=Boudabousia marimammalium TaxID=156892 RepID=A0A1Q5PMI0_9ACTO|nr:preprotein translocase subunit SecE [Boudabousia marimammalium]OKL48754.1 preprotein translocase subunit SecE [Boudabousia marimammalium]